MNATVNTFQTNEGFDLFRLTKSKEIVDVAPNTLRAWHEKNPNRLPFYKRGKPVFVSKRDVEAYIRSGE